MEQLFLKIRMTFPNLPDNCCTIYPYFDASPFGHTLRAATIPYDTRWCFGILLAFTIESYHGACFSVRFSFSFQGLEIFF